jgi:hypothetical protein
MGRAWLLLWAYSSSLQARQRGLGTEGFWGVQCSGGAGSDSSGFQRVEPRRCLLALSHLSAHLVSREGAEWMLRNGVLASSFAY